MAILAVSQIDTLSEAVVQIKPSRHAAATGAGSTMTRNPAPVARTAARQSSGRARGEGGWRPEEGRSGGRYQISVSISIFGMFPSTMLHCPKQAVDPGPFPPRQAGLSTVRKLDRLQ